MRNTLIAAVRTLVQSIVALLATVPWISDLGVETYIEGLLTALGVGLVTFVLNWLEKRFPWLTPILSLGLSKSTADYATAA